MYKIDDIRDKHSTEMGFLILLCRAYTGIVNREDVNKYTEDNNIDWKRVYKIIRSNRIRPFIYRILSENTINADEQFLIQLRDDCMFITRQNLERLNEMLRLHKLFQAKGIQVLPYKGLVLSKQLFDDYITRETVDIDFLISANDFEKLREIFLAEGYQSDYYYNANFKSFLLRNDTEFMFYKTIGSGNKIKVEIHWGIIHKIQGVKIENATLFKNATLADILNSKVEVLALEDELLVMLVHHGINDVWKNLKHLIDIIAFLKKYGSSINWESFEQRVSAHKILHTTQIGFNLCKELAGSNIPGNFYYPKLRIERILNDLLRFPPVEGRKLFAEYKRQVYLRDSTMSKLRLTGKYILVAIIPNMRDVEDMKLPPKLSFLYYLIKPFRMIQKHLIK